MALWPFTEMIDALNGVYQSVVGLPGIFGAIVALLATVLFYPIVNGINLIYKDVNLVYSTVAQLINIVLYIPNYISTMFSVWLPTNIPSVWTVLFLMSIGISVYLRVSRLIKYARGWIPIIWGGGD